MVYISNTSSCLNFFLFRKEAEIKKLKANLSEAPKSDEVFRYIKISILVFIWVCINLTLSVLSPVHLTLWKIAIWMSKNCQKLDIFFKKIAKNFHFFKKIAIGNFFEKNKIFFCKNVEFLAIFWQSNSNFPEG